MSRRNLQWFLSICVWFLLVSITRMSSVRGLSLSTAKRISNPRSHPSFRKDETSICPKDVIRLGYTSNLSTSETSSDLLVLSQRPLGPAPASESLAVITTATKTTPITTGRSTTDPLGVRRIEVPPILPVNVSLSTTVSVITPPSSEPVLKMSKIWQRVKIATHVDKEAIAKLGVSFGLTYNLISNINGSISLSLAWYIASVKVRESSLQQKFLAKNIGEDKILITKSVLSFSVILSLCRPVFPRWHRDSGSHC
jgi:hypothetical protein